jgi:protein-tyrosine phosphatase
MWAIRERLFLGDYDSGLEALAGGVQPVEPSGELSPFSGIVSLCPMPLLAEDQVEEPASELTEWLKLPISDGGKGEGELEGALGVALPFVRRRMQSGNVLVHCAAGMSRSVAVVAAVLCEEGLSVEQAFDRIVQAKATRETPSFELLIAPAAEFRSCLGRLYRIAGAKR